MSSLGQLPLAWPSWDYSFLYVLICDCGAHPDEIDPRASCDPSQIAATQMPLSVQSPQLAQPRAQPLAEPGAGGVRGARCEDQQPPQQIAQQSAAHSSGQPTLHQSQQRPQHAAQQQSRDAAQVQSKIARMPSDLADAHAHFAIEAGAMETPKRAAQSAGARFEQNAGAPQARQRVEAEVRVARATSSRAGLVGHSPHTSPLTPRPRSAGCAHGQMRSRERKTASIASRSAE
eukprot:6197995-Pleurochrysis_carterae.AAC.1